MLSAYLQRCVLPRVTYSPADAAFCAAFTRRLHEMALPFFPTILYFDTVRARAPARPLPLKQPSKMCYPVHAPKVKSCMA